MHIAYNLKVIYENIKKENETYIENENELKKVKETQEGRYKTLNGKLIFVVLYIKRELTRDGRHKREIIVDNALYQKYGKTIEALNTKYLLDYEYTITETFKTIEEAEQFVKEVIEKIKQELERIKEEYEKEKQYKELEEILLY